MLPLDAIKTTLDALPIAAALVSGEGRLIFANGMWVSAEQKYKDDGLMSVVGEAWPNEGLYDQRLYQNLSREIGYIFDGSRDKINQKAELDHRGYSYNLNIDLTPLPSGSTTLCLVCIRLDMNAYSSPDQPSALRPDNYLILNSLREGVVIQDAKGVITANNPASEIILGLSADQMRGLTNADPQWGTIWEDGTPCPAENHPSSLAISTGKPVLDFTMGVHHSSGNISWLKINSQPIFAEGSQTPYMSITSFVDITEERRRQQMFKAVSERLQLALDAGDIGIWEYNISSRQLSWDDTMYKIFDTTPEDFNGSVDDALSFIHPEDSTDIRDKLTRSIETQCGFTTEFKILTRSKELRYVYVAAKVLLNNQAKPDTIISINRNITAERSITEEIKKSREKLKQFIERMPVGAISIEDKAITLNNYAEVITGYKKEEIADIDDLFRKLKDVNGQRCNQLQDLMSTGTFGKCTVLNIRRKDDEMRWIEFNGCKLEDGQAWVMKDITDQVSAEAKLKHLAFYDSLTQLPNRAAIEDRLHESIGRAERNGHTLGLLVLDLDLFKNVNDTYGHPIGDQLLVVVAERLKNNIRIGDMMGRIGGDEFMVVVENPKDEASLLDKCQALIAEISKKVELSNNVVLSTGICIGASIFPNHGKDAVTLFKNSDTALYKAKALGRNKAQIYKPSFTVALKTRLTMEQRIDKAFANEEFSLHYQPIVDCATNEIVSAEALIRWHDEELGYISPADFIPIAEETGKIIEIGDWVTHESCKQLAQWKSSGLDLSCLSVNLSPKQFSDEALFRSIQSALNTWGIDPKQLALEITEGILMNNRSLTKNLLLNLKALGVRLAIDDFGTGYSSLAYLKYFDVDILKIDRSFIKDIDREPSDFQITSAIISIAKTFNLKVVAEGVENIEQLDLLNDVNCNLYQGFFKSPALPSHKFKQLFTP
ncbi:PAS domain S-box-containing protein/diguanylate cyclase (GGDEF) domain-containing protein [Alteromonadaceae bacterium Bs31]|nr:PAS domain S-box-containing protein/diguanylate cyclase (GGDEF) domain-containing protein [Alteromonadaceae bacterium Bs31]